MAIALHHKSNATNGTVKLLLLWQMCDVVVQVDEGLRIVEGAESLQSWATCAKSSLPSADFLHWIAEEQREQVCASVMSGQQSFE